MAIAAIASIASAGAAILGGIQAYQMGRYQQQLAEQNAQIAEDNARRAIQRAQVEQYDQDMVTLAFLGEQEAIQAASGLGGRSQFLVRKASAELGRRDALNVRQAGEIEAYNYLTQAVSQRAEGEMAAQSGRYGLLSGFVRAVPSLVGQSRAVRSPRRFDPNARITV